MLIFVLEMLVEDVVQSSSIKRVEKLSELLCLWREMTTAARIAGTDEGTGEQDDGEDDEESVLDSRHHGSSRSVVSDRQLGGRVVVVCGVRGGQI